MPAGLWGRLRPAGAPACTGAIGDVHLCSCPRSAPCAYSSHVPHYLHSITFWLVFRTKKDQHHKHILLNIFRTLRSSLGLGGAAAYCAAAATASQHACRQVPTTANGFDNAIAAE